MSLRKKLLLMILGPVVLTVIGWLCFSLHRELQHGREASVGNLRGLIQASSRDLSRIAREDSQEAHVHLAERLSAFDQLEYLSATDTSGSVFFAYRRDGLDPKEAPRESEPAGLQFWGGRILLSTALHRHGVHFGDVVILAEAPRLAGLLNRQIVPLLGVLVALALLGFFLAWRLQSWVSRPISSLADLARKVAVEGDYGLRTGSEEIRKRGEIGWLARGFNAVLERVQESQSQIRRESDANAATARSLAVLNKRMEAILRSTQDGLALIDPELGLVFANARFMQLLDVNEADLKVSSVDGLIQLLSRGTIEGRALWRGILEGVTADTQDNEPIKWVREASPQQARPKASTKVSLSIKSEGLFLEGELLGRLLVVHDITAAEEAVRNREELNQKQRLEAVGHLAGGVAHDFNNLLTVILGSCEDLLARDRRGEAVRRESLKEILFASEKAAQITRQLLAFSRKQPLERVAIELGCFLDEAKALLENACGAGVDICILGSTIPLWIEADRGQLMQVLLNLVVNARDALSGTHGSIRIGVSAAEIDSHARHASAARADTSAGLCVLFVVDNGAGMDAETLGHAAEPYFTTKQAGQGTGLGLSTVHGIVLQNGGEMLIESTLGKGTRVAIRLPRIEPPEAVSVDAPRPLLSNRNGSTIVVLVVEDADSVRGIVCRTLRDEGFRVLEAEDGIAAIELMESSEVQPDFILTDLLMPRLGGIELIDRLLRRDACPPYGFMTGYADDPRLASIREDQLTRVLSKPFSRDGLLGFVAEGLERGALPLRNQPMGSTVPG